MTGIHIGIDASNIRQGGGVTHLTQLLRSAEPEKNGIGRVTIWVSQETAECLPRYPWLKILTPSWVERALPVRLLWQHFFLGREMREAECDILFSPGGSLPLICSITTVVMSQNMLPFEPKEAAKFGRWSIMRFKMWLLRQSQLSSFRRSDGVVFLTKYAKRIVNQHLRFDTKEVVTIPHGVEERFRQLPRRQLDISCYCESQPFEFLYVSILMPYKHQIEVAHAIARLRQEGWPVAISFIGPDWGDYGNEFRRHIKAIDPKESFLHWLGATSFEKLDPLYRQADAFVFASSCENLPNIMIEAMAAGLPIASARRGPMPEILGDAGIYFDPEDVTSIADTLRVLIENPHLREKLAQIASIRAKDFSWNRCAENTLSFIAHVQRIKKSNSESAANV